MLKELRFVQGAVAKKDFIPELTHFKIENGMVSGYNGMLALCTPIALDITCKPKAEPLVKAINKCKDTVHLSMTKAGRLAIKSGSFKAFVECVEGETPHVIPEGDMIEIDGETFLEAITKLFPVIGDDASRPWCNGIMVRGNTATATNNVIVAEYWLGFSLSKPCNIPGAAIKEMIRIGEPPTHLSIGDTSITAHYANGKWVRSQLYSTDWPDITKVFEGDSKPELLNPELFEALEALKPFVDKMGKIFMEGDVLKTHLDPLEGATYEIDGFGVKGIFNITMLQVLEGVADRVDFTSWPAPCHFAGEKLRGAIVGMRPANAE